MSFFIVSILGGAHHENLQPEFYRITSVSVEYTCICTWNERADYLMCVGS